METPRCICGAQTWQDGWCMTCDLPEGASEEHYSRLVDAAYPAVDRLPFPPIGGRFAQASRRIGAALRAQPTGLRMDDLQHQTGLGWDELYPLVERGLERRQLRGEQLPDRRSQGEMVSGGARYTVAMPRGIGGKMRA